MADKVGAGMVDQLLWPCCVQIMLLLISLFFFLYHSQYLFYVSSSFVQLHYLKFSFVNKYTHSE